MIELGDKVKDLVSGLVGIAISRIEFINGCIQIGVQPKLEDKEVEIVVWNIDMRQLKVVKKKAIECFELDVIGGAMTKATPQ